MKKLIFITIISLSVLSLASCRNKHEQNRAEQRIENTKDSINKALDNASGRIEKGADKTKDTWNETKKDVKDGAQQVKQEIKKDYNKAKKEVKDKLD